MTDIVERLRTHRHGFDRNGSHTTDRYVCLCDHDADEAADEIERLRNDHEAAICLARDMGESAAKLHKLLREVRGVIQWYTAEKLIKRIDAALGNEP